MNAHVAAPFHCPACNALLQLTIEPGHAQQPAPSAPLPPLPQAPAPPLVYPPRPAAPVYPPPPPRGLVPTFEPQRPPVAARTTYPPHPLPPPRQPPTPHRHRLSPQATLLSLGVLLLLAAGVTFLAVTWHNLPVHVQAGIIGTLAALAFAGSVPASRHSLTGTAEAFA